MTSASGSRRSGKSQHGYSAAMATAYDPRVGARAEARRRLALALPGTTPGRRPGQAEAPHFDRRAFRAARITVTLAAPTPAVAPVRDVSQDGRFQSVGHRDPMSDVGHSEHGSPEQRTSDGATANFKFTPEEQAMKLMLQPEAFAAVPGGSRPSGLDHRPPRQARRCRPRCRPPHRARACSGEGEEVIARVGVMRARR
jgi:hypothetical protein